MVRITQLKII